MSAEFRKETTVHTVLGDSDASDGKKMASKIYRNHINIYDIHVNIYRNHM